MFAYEEDPYTYLDGSQRQKVEGKMKDVVWNLQQNRIQVKKHEIEENEIALEMKKTKIM